MSFATGDRFLKVPFSASIPSKENIKPQDAKERLAEIQIILTEDTQHHAYLFKWNNVSVPIDMLPDSTHTMPGYVGCVEQFHAVKAMKDISNNRMTVLHGPGFTGGGLVLVPAGQSLEFFLPRSPNRWFSGRYKVRIWFYRSTAARTIKISALPPPGFASSAVEAVIPGANVETNLDSPQYADLIQHTFNGQLLLTAEMTYATLNLQNSSLSSSIVLDRIELIFDSSATL